MGAGSLAWSRRDAAALSSLEGNLNPNTKIGGSSDDHVSRVCC